MSIQENDWRLILKRIRDQNCIAFLGAGASLGFSGGPGLPTGPELAEELAKECRYPGSDRSDLFRVAQYYSLIEFDAFELRKAVVKRLRVPGVRPGAVHTALANLPFRYVLTTNFDNLMERAFEEVGKKSTPVTYERHGDRKDIRIATVDEPIVYKLHGSLDHPSAGMVLTEDDVIDFLSCMMLGDPPIPASIKGLFDEHSILFVGYGLKDWTIRVMLRALRDRKKGSAPDIASFAVQKRPNETVLATEWDHSVIYWEKRESLRCFDMDAVEFVTELGRRHGT